MNQASFISAINLYTWISSYASLRKSVLSLRCGGGKQREEELKKQGWNRQFVTDEPRLSEAVELYRELGYEVHLEQTTFEELNQVCRNCIEADCEKYKTIYIRKKT